MFAAPVARKGENFVISRVNYFAEFSWYFVGHLFRSYSASRVSREINLGEFTGRFGLLSALESCFTFYVTFTLFLDAPCQDDS